MAMRVLAVGRRRQVPSVFSFNSDEELEEERRLMYVAVTRAKRHLFLTYPINVRQELRYAAFEAVAVSGSRVAAFV